MAKQKRVKVAIVGGGCAAVTAAFELSRPEHEGRYDITLYQQGWRLGGKGASGRGVNGRIEEHGIHLWMGHYDNAFHLMRECYRELDRDPRTCPLADWTDAFVPDPYIGITDVARSDGQQVEWQRLMASFTPFPGLPGDPYDDSMPITVIGYLTRSAKLLYILLQAADGAARRAPGGQDHPASAHRESTENGFSTEALVAAMSRWLNYGELATYTAVLQGVALLESAFAMVPQISEGLLGRFLDAVRDGTRRLLEPLLAGDPQNRYLWEIIDIVLATLRGAVRFGLATDPRGFDAINDYDAREWLLLNGASERSVESGFVRGLYDLAFAYEDGDPERPAIAAGQGLRGGFRMLFTYRGSLFWKMQAGMGDVVFAPFYEVLRNRGVRFEFFHRLENVALGKPAKGEKPFIRKLAFDVQAEVEQGGEYQPLVDFHGLPCWPAQPDWHQLVRGDELHAEGRQFESWWDDRRESQKTLKVGRDFDCVILGISIGAIPHVCSELVEADPRWRTMVEQVKTVPTQCFQIWMKQGMDGVGWHEPPPNLSAFVEPFDTWADMSHLAPVESWPCEPGSIAYFCNALPEETPHTQLDRRRKKYPNKRHKAVRRNAIRFLDRDIVHLWPDAQKAPGEFRWGLLMNPGDDSTEEHPDAGEEAFDGQFWIANVNPTDRYVLSLPGTLQHRISPLDGTYDNLIITGDWTDCGFNFGCVEAAVMSGRLAAHALSLTPRLEDIFGFDHP
ncbi:MAG: NAD(P)-binding protein [Pseudomonadales bacterium]